MKNNSLLLNLIVRNLLLTFLLVFLLFPSVSSAGPENKAPFLIQASFLSIVEGNEFSPVGKFICSDEEDGIITEFSYTPSITSVTPVGSYPISVWCIDSEGLQSNIVNTTVVVSPFGSPEEPEEPETPPTEKGTPPGGLVPCEGKGCGSCDLIVMVQRILTWLIGVMLVIFAILVAWAGFGLVTSGGNPAAKTEAKKKMTNAFVGIIIVLGAWLFVDTLMKALLPGGLLPSGDGKTLRPWSKIECTTQAETFAPTPPPPSTTLFTFSTECAPQAGGVEPIIKFMCTHGPEPIAPYSTGCTLTSTVNPPPPPVTQQWVTGWDCDMRPPPGVKRSLFVNDGISINKSECPLGERYQDVPGGCTSVEGFNSGTVSVIFKMKNECGTLCSDFTITGGSEFGHTGFGAGTHAGGDKFDLGASSNIDSYMRNPLYFTKGPDRVREVEGVIVREETRVNIQTGTTCWREITHWDCRR